MTMVRLCPRRRLTAAGLTLIGWAAPLSSQNTQPGLVVPSPSPGSVVVRVDSFTAPDGSRRQLDIYRPRGAKGALPIVAFVNVVGPDMRQWRGYVEWARLVTGRGLAAVHYDGPIFDPARPMADNLARANATLDSVLVTLTRRGAALGIDGDNVVLWAGSANTSTGTPVALEGHRPSIHGYILYYGSGRVSAPRIDVPVFIARAGLDAVALNQSLDSLTSQLTTAGVPVTLVNYPGGSHAFDIRDSTAMTARVIDQTLDFAEAAVRPALQRAIAVSGGEVAASAAFNAKRWDEAVTRYRGVANQRPNAGGVFWRLGLAQLEARDPSGALASFVRARDLGIGGARDIGLPAARAALRANQRDTAVAWLTWALERYPPVRQTIAADPELSPVLPSSPDRRPNDRRDR